MADTWDRDNRKSTNKATELSFGLPSLSDQDPTGTFPFPGHWNSTNLNFAATGGKYNSLSVGGSLEDLPLNMGSAVEAQYP